MTQTQHGIVEFVLVAAVVLLAAWVIRLRRQVDLDPLTGVANRRAWDRALRKSGGRPRAVALFDLDLLKSVNDEQGHAIGDRVLLVTAEALRDTAPPGSLVARLGGDEFGVLLAVDPANAQIVETLRQAVSARLARDGLPRLSISAGVSDDAVAGASTADAALREAKRGGRDRTVHAR